MRAPRWTKDTTSIYHNLCATNYPGQVVCKSFLLDWFTAHKYSPGQKEKLKRRHGMNISDWLDKETGTTEF